MGPRKNPANNEGNGAGAGGGAGAGAGPGAGAGVGPVVPEDLPVLPENVKPHIDSLSEKMASFGAVLESFQKSIQEAFNIIAEVRNDMVSRKIEEEGFQTRLWDKVENIKSDIQTTKEALNVDVTMVKNKVQRMPSSMELERMLEERNRNETAMVTSIGDAEDSLDFSFTTRMSATAQLECVAWEDRENRSAPAFLKHSLLQFRMPCGNKNWLNAREKSMTATENALLDKFEIIPCREEFLKALRTGRTSNLSPEEEAIFRKEVFTRGQRWNSDFVRDTNDWTIDEDFELWFRRFWRTAERNLVEDVKLFKQILYERIYSAKGKDLGEMILPEENKSCSALMYYLQLRRLVIPVSDPETAVQLFYNLKQVEGQTVDKFFQQKLRMFRNMYPAGEVTKRQWRDFYFSVSKTLLYKDLAVDMARYVDTMINLSDYGAFLNHMLKRCQYYVNWANSDHFSSENISSCYSDALLELRKKSGLTEVETKTVINVVQKEEVLEQDKDYGTDDEWIGQVERVIGALNSRNQKCWHCNKAGHFMNDCWSRRKNEPPAPDARFGKVKKIAGDKFPAKSPPKFVPSKVPNNRVLPDQFARAAVNQVETAQEPEEVDEVEKERRTMEQILQEIYLKQAPIE